MRLHDWALRLESLIDDRLHTRFSFCQHDCCMWACDVVLAVTGRDPVADLRGTYSTEEEAAAVMEAGGGLAAMAEARFGPEIKPLAAAAGDVGIIDTDLGPALVACGGATWLAASGFGVVAVDQSQVLRAWRCEVI